LPPPGEVRWSARPVHIFDPQRSSIDIESPCGRVVVRRNQIAEDRWMGCRSLAIADAFDASAVSRCKAHR
jgi:hypothetical protein